LKRRRLSYWIFGTCVVVLTLVLGWITVVTLRVERTAHAARVENRRQESLRLALWRMDSELAPLVAQEAARPFSDYLAPSPLTRYRSEVFLLHFEVADGNLWRSPQTSDLESPGAEPEGSPHRERLEQVRRWTDFESLHSRLDVAEREMAALVELAAPVPRDVPGALLEEEATQRVVSNVLSQSRMQQWNQGRVPAATAMVGRLLPLWISTPEDPVLILARRAAVGGSERVQGILVDWDETRGLLLARIEDLFDKPRLVPVIDSPVGLDDAATRLATIPARLEVPVGAMSPMPRWTPLRLALIAAWIAGAAAVVAGAIALRTTLAHAERRHRFASAVTHELRTPLTTFRMYSQMLADGSITEPEHRQRYLEVLERESDRLGHLVESVLSYSRLEEGMARIEKHRTTVGELIEHVLEPLVRRAETLSVQIRLPESTAIETDADVVGQILFNLVDNASKYAGPDGIELSVEPGRHGRELVLAVGDRGPGIPIEHRDAIFSPFDRGGRDSSDKTSGVGLGLALARGLARDLGGDLRLDPERSPGARFELRLPV
jgi:signal transduction histidine kinase